MESNGLGRDVPVAKRLLEWTRRSLSEPGWGAGAEFGSFMAELQRPDFRHVLFTGWTNGIVEIRFRRLKRWPPFAAEDKQRELMRRLNAVPGINYPEEATDGLPGIRFSVLAAEPAMREFLELLDWMALEIRSA